MPEDKKAFAHVKNNLNLHVALLMRDGKSKPDAYVIAYREGTNGLNARLNPTGAPK